MIIPKRLQLGQTVMLLSVSSPTTPARLPLAVAALERLGLHVRVSETCTAQYGNLAGSDALRARELQAAFADPTIDAILCVRGGYGATRILPLLDLQAIAKTPKLFAGYSDVTALHIAFTQQCGFETYHTPMPSTELYKLAEDDFTWQSYRQTLMADASNSYPLMNHPDEPRETLVGGKATGRLIGGNLALVQASLGTPFEIDCTDGILFLEDIDENTERIDRMLTQLRNAGKLAQLNGILLGAWTNCGAVDEENPQNSLTLRQVFEQLLVPLNVPIVAGVTCGHVTPTLSLPMGRQVTMDATNQTVIIHGV